MKHLYTTIALLATTLTTTAQSFSGGSGTEADPWLISNHADLDALNTLTNTEPADGSSPTYGKYFLLTQDITDPYTGMIGTAANFNGHFNGGGHCITLAINRTWDTYPCGLFGTATQGSVHDLAVDGSVSVYRGAAIVGNPGEGVTLYNLVNYADVTATSASTLSGVGGVAGNMVSQTAASSMKNCANYGTITCEGGAVGGVVGYSGQRQGNTLENLANYGYIVGTASRVAGVIGNPLYDDQVHCCVSFGTLSSDELSGCIGNANPTDLQNIFYDAQHACTSVSIPAQEKNTADLVGTQMSATLGDGWTYTEGLLPRPTMGGLENDPRALLYAVPVMLEAGDNLKNVTKDFLVGYEINGEPVTWTVKNGLVQVYADGEMVLLGSGEETLTATYKGYERTVRLIIDATAGISNTRTEARTKTDGAWYTTTGQRVSHPTHGLYIHNGQTVLVR